MFSKITFLDLVVRDCHQISLLILSRFKRIKKLLVPLKSSENLWFNRFYGAIDPLIAVAFDSPNSFISEVTHIETSSLICFANQWTIFL